MRKRKIAITCAAVGFLTLTFLTAGVQVRTGFGKRRLQAIPGGTLDPASVTKYVTPLVVPPAMPLQVSNKNKDFYKIAVRQFRQQILPASDGIPQTTVWSYGSTTAPGTVLEGGSFHYPAFTIEAKWNKLVQVQWRNELVDAKGNFLPHLLPVDQSLHWANPPGGMMERDMRPEDPPQSSYRGPVPIVTHVHGAHVFEDSDGYPEAWYLPNAKNIPAGYATTGTYFDIYNARYGNGWTPGVATFRYPNDQRATTLWYHDHALGMTRLNVYAGPAGFYLLRGGPDDVVKVKGTNTTAVLPGPAPGVGANPFGTYYEIPIAIQDRSFNADGSLFYPDNRAFFEGLNVPGKPAQIPGQPLLRIPFVPDPACGGPSDISPIWNPEFFGNITVVNGYSWPYLNVEKLRYRFRFLNGCNSRFLILVGTTQDPTALGPDERASQDLTFWQIGTEGGFLPAPVPQTELLMGNAERADVIVDFSAFNVGDVVYLTNEAPDEPFGGGIPGTDFDISDSATTRQVLQFRIVAGGPAVDPTTPPDQLDLPFSPLGPQTGPTRQLTLNELDSETIKVSEDANGDLVLDCADGETFGPLEAQLGTLADGHLEWQAPITENPDVGSTEVWELHNFTEDAHPIHLHLVMFQVVNRETSEGAVRGPEPWETGYKDTVIAYPGEITRVKARFDHAGLFVWHCHIVEHEDNEMMRPYQVGPIPTVAATGRPIR
jgi:FtsP/CotA-like multicopper oxidase with cupredoxin domain